MSSSPNRGMQLSRVVSSSVPLFCVLTVTTLAFCWSKSSSSVIPVTLSGRPTPDCSFGDVLPAKGDPKYRNRYAKATNSTILTSVGIGIGLVHTRAANTSLSRFFLYLSVVSPASTAEAYKPSCCADPAGSLPKNPGRRCRESTPMAFMLQLDGLLSWARIVTVTMTSCTYWDPPFVVCS